MARASTLSAWRYVLRNLGSRRTRSTLTVLGIAVAVTFFVLFAAMSAGLQSFIDDELDRPRPVHMYLEPASPTPFDREDVDYIGLVVEQSFESDTTTRWTTPRVELPMSSSTLVGPVRLWGVWVEADDDVVTPPYDLSAKMAWGRHLGTEDGAGSGPIACVLGASVQETMFPQAEEGKLIPLAPDATVDPWWMPDASSYPLEGKSSVTAPPRGPVEARIVGVLAPGQDPELDWGVFVPINPLLRALGQFDAVSGNYYYPEVVVTIEDGSSVDMRALEANLALQLPGVEGTDDAWDRSSFEEAYGSTSNALEGWLTVVTFVLAVMLVAGVSDTTLVAVADRRREIATLRAVGIGRRQVQRLVLTEVMTLAGIGLVIGLLVGIIIALTFGHLHEVTGGEGIFMAPVSINPMVIAGAVVLALGAAALAAAYPAFRASREPPTEALRYE